MRIRVPHHTIRALIHITIVALVAPFLVLATATPARAEPSANSTITGTVTGTGGTRKYAFTVSLLAVDPERWDQPRLAFPLADGSYSFSGLPAGTYTLYFRGMAGDEVESEWWNDALTRNAAELIVLDGQNTVVADAVIGLMGAVRGRTTGLGGSAVPNFGVSVYRIEGANEQQVPASLSWPAGGVYSIENLLPGTYRIIYGKEGYRDSETTVTIGIDETVTRDIQLEPRDVGELGSLTTEPVVLPYWVRTPSTIRLKVLPKVFADVMAVDASACQAGPYAWTAALLVSSPSGADESSAAFDGGGADPGTAPSVSRTHEAAFYNAGDLLLGTHSARVEITSTVSYGSCGDAGVEQRTHTWHETLLTGLEVTGELYAFTPRVVGSPARGQTVTATGSFSPEPGSMTYRWLRDGVAITAATAQTYTLGADDVDAQISVEVVGHKDHYADLAAVSPATAPVTGDAWTLTPVPTITGTPATGQTLSVLPGTWDAGTALTYQWLRDGVAIPGGTNSTYRLVSADLGSLVSVKLTGRRPGAARMSKTSKTHIVVEGTSAVPTPTISGVFGTGQVLTAIPGSLAAGTTLTYEWLRNGHPIRFGTGPTYRLTSADPGARISVRVTAHLDGCPDVSGTSTPSAKVMRISRPRIAGALTVGSRLSVSRGRWTSKVSFAYQWFRDGAPLKSATRTSYNLARADAGAELTLRVTAHRSGYARVIVSSGHTLRVVSTGTPRISGRAVVGSTVTANPGNWSPGMVPSFQWLRNGTRIPGAASSTYTPGTGDEGARLTVRVTEEQAGWAAVVRTSGKTPKIMKSGIPVITGMPAVGSTVKAVVGSWTAKVGFSYQWMRNGVPIKGATGSRYAVISRDAGAQLIVRVAGRRKGYAAAAVPSAAVLVPRL